MKKVYRGLVCGVAAAATTGACFNLGIHVEIAPQDIEVCYGSLKQLPVGSKVPEVCYNGTQTLFPTKEVTSDVVSVPGEEPSPSTTEEMVTMSAEAYRPLAYELKVTEDSKRQWEILGSMAAGVIIGGALYYSFGAESTESPVVNVQGDSSDRQ